MHTDVSISLELPSETVSERTGTKFTPCCSLLRPLVSFGYHAITHPFSRRISSTTQCSRTCSIYPRVATPLPNSHTHLPTQAATSRGTTLYINVLSIQCQRLQRISPLFLAIRRVPKKHQRLHISIIFLQSTLLPIKMNMFPRPKSLGGTNKTNQKL